MSTKVYTFQQISANFCKFRQISGNLKGSWGNQEAELGEPGRPATEWSSTKDPVAGGTGGDRGLDPASKNKSKNPSKPSLVREKTKLLVVGGA